MKAVPLIVLGLWLVAPALAEPLAKGDCWLAPMVATQWFDGKLDLESGVALGARAGFALDRRFGLAMDFAQSTPNEKGSSQTARISSLRAIAVVRPVEVAVQPYLLAGFGGLLFHYGDARDSAGSSATLGGGLEYAATKHARIFAEYSAQFYRLKMVTYSSAGAVQSSSDPETDAIQSISGGVSVGF